MMVLAYEWKKLMIGQRGLACLLAALVGYNLPKGKRARTGSRRRK